MSRTLAKCSVRQSALIAAYSSEAETPSPGAHEVQGLGHGVGVHPGRSFHDLIGRKAGDALEFGGF